MPRRAFDALRDVANQDLLNLLNLLLAFAPCAAVPRHIEKVHDPQTARDARHPYRRTACPWARCAWHLELRTDGGRVADPFLVLPAALFRLRRASVGLRVSLSQGTLRRTLCLRRKETHEALDACTNLSLRARMICRVSVLPYPTRLWRDQSLVDSCSSTKRQPCLFLPLIREGLRALDSICLERMHRGGGYSMSRWLNPTLCRNNYAWKASSRLA